MYKNSFIFKSPSYFREVSKSKKSSCFRIFMMARRSMSDKVFQIVYCFSLTIILIESIGDNPAVMFNFLLDKELHFFLTLSQNSYLTLLMFLKSILVLISVFIF